MRIKRLWDKVRMFVKLRGCFDSVRAEMELKEMQEILDSRYQTEDDLSHRDYNSSEDEKDNSQSNSQLKWYQFNTSSYSMQIWDSFFALVVLTTCFWNPLAIVFKERFHENEESDINWVLLDSFNNGFWALAFVINLNRVNFKQKIESFEETCKAYLKSLFLVPDLICLLLSIVFIIIDEPLTAK